MTKKICSKCKQEKDREIDFHHYRSGPRKGRVWAHCKECRKIHLYKWRKENPDKYKENYTKGRLKYKYGLTPDQVKTFGICPLCDRERRLVVDHCHSKGHVRGFICHNCNTLLGHIENKDKMKRIKEYLLNARLEEDNKKEKETS